MPTRSLTRLASVWMFLVVVLSSVGCVLLTDAATRLAQDLASNAASLRASAEEERTFVHTPRSWPAGCDGPYTVTLIERATLAIGCAKEYPNISYSTTSHLNAVTVPARLSASKRAGETLSVTLRKHGTAVDVVRLQ